MTNTIAIGIGLLLLALIGVNMALGLDAHIFVARKLADLIEWLAFWR